MGLLGQLLDVERPHCAGQPDVQLRDGAFAHNDPLDAQKGEPLVEACHVLLVARQTVKSLGNDDIEHAPVGFIEQLLIAGTEM
jgi:hypothetical protein